MPTAPAASHPRFHAAIRTALIALLACLGSLTLAGHALAQYVWIDTNGDGVNTAADVVAPSGSTALDIWIRTDQNANGSPAVCASNDGLLTLTGYSIELLASNGTIAWGTITNQRPEFPLGTVPISDGHILVFGYAGAASDPPGAYRLATVAVSVAAGTPRIDLAPQATSFGSACSGTDLDSVIKLGVDFTDAAGIAYGGTANQPPAIAPIADVSMAEAETHDVPVSATDPEGDLVTLSLGAAPTWASLTSSPAAGTANGTVHLAPGYDDSGDASITVRAADPFAQSQRSFAVHVANTNRAPVIVPLDSMNLAEGTVLNTTLQANDPDDDPCTFFVAQGPTFVTVTTGGTTFGTTVGNLLAAPQFADAGRYVVIVGVKDPSGAADSTTYTLNVREQDRPPVLTVPGPVSGTEGEPITFTASATDPDGDMVEYFTDPLPAGAQLVDQMNGTAIFSWTPGFDQAGAYTITITANDMHGASVQGSVTVTVADVTDPVAIARPADMQVVEGDTQDQALLAVDVAGNPLTFTKVSGPAYVTVSTTDPGTGTAHGLVRVAPGASDAGPATVTIGVSDGTNSDQTTFHVMVLAVAPGQAPFIPPFVHVPVGLTPHTVLTADVNEDGIPDLITGNLGSNTVSILPGLGGLTFGQHVNLTTASKPHTVVARDVNGDGHLDLVVSQIGANSFAVFLGHGNGTFGPRNDFPLGGSPVFVGVADFNEDGKLDVVATDQTVGALKICLGHGDGTFGAPVAYPTAPGAHGLSVADFNRDGHMDAAVAASTANGAVSVLLGRGDGTFMPKIDFHTSAPHTIVAGDLDGDGNLDLVVSNFDTGRITIALGHGDGTFQTLPEIPTGTNPHSSAIGDVNLDGHPDIIVANQGSNTLSFIMGQGGASWAPRADFPVGLGPHSIAIADLDGDHLPEVTCSNINANTVTILKNRVVVAHPARVFAMGTSRTLILRAGGPAWNLDVESADGQFTPNDIALESVQLHAQGTGSVDHIGANIVKGMTVVDADNNGVQEAVINFSRDDLRSLFSGVNGRQSVNVTLDGRLTDGTTFRGTTAIQVVGGGPPGKPIASAKVTPNPLNPAGTISFELDRPEAVSIRIYDARGRLVRRAMDSKPLDVGVYRIPFEGVTDHGTPLASGVYFFKITTRDGDASGRFAVLR